MSIAIIVSFHTLHLHHTQLEWIVHDLYLFDTINKLE
jgi:hypothetical protein